MSPDLLNWLAFGLGSDSAKVAARTESCFTWLRGNSDFEDLVR